MKFNWRPDAMLELVRAIVPALILFGFVSWTAEQTAGIYLGVSAILTWITVTFLTVDTKTLEDAGTSKVQVREAAAANIAAGTPGGTGTPGETGGSGGASAPRGLGNMSDKASRGLLLALALIPALALAGCGGKRITTPAGGARAAGDVLELANEAHKAVFDGYVAGTIPTSVSDPIMAAYETKLIPTARKVMVALRAWETATTVDLKAVRAGDLQAALALFDGAAKDVFGMALPPGVATTIQDIATRARSIVDQIRALVAAARADAGPYPEPFTVGGRILIEQPAQ